MFYSHSLNYQIYSNDSLCNMEGHILNTHPGPGKHNGTQEMPKITSWLSMNDIWDVGRFGQIIQVHKIQC